MGKQDYKKTEKWWLGLVILFYVLYNLPGVPKYGDPTAAIWHGLLTIVPLWVIVYGGMIMLNRQRRLTNKNVPSTESEVPASRAGSEKEVI